MLEKLGNIAKKRIIVMTTNGFMPQEPLRGNIYQEHISGWFTEDFTVRGIKHMESEALNSLGVNLRQLDISLGMFGYFYLI